MCNEIPLSGVTGTGDKDMTTKTLAATQVKEESGFAGIALALLGGLSLIFIAGVSQASVFHDAAHDQRHAISFPCH